MHVLPLTVFFGHHSSVPTRLVYTCAIRFSYFEARIVGQDGGITINSDVSIKGPTDVDFSSRLMPFLGRFPIEFLQKIPIGMKPIEFRSIEFLGGFDIVGILSGEDSIMHRLDVFLISGVDAADKE